MSSDQVFRDQLQVLYFELERLQRECENLSSLIGEVKSIARDALINGASANEHDPGPIGTERKSSEMPLIFRWRGMRQ